MRLGGEHGRCRLSREPVIERTLTIGRPEAVAAAAGVVLAPRGERAGVQVRPAPHCLCRRLIRKRARGRGSGNKPLWGSHLGGHEPLRCCSPECSCSVTPVPLRAQASSAPSRCCSRSASSSGGFVPSRGPRSSWSARSSRTFSGNRLGTLRSLRRLRSNSPDPVRVDRTSYPHGHRRSRSRRRCAVAPRPFNAENAFESLSSRLLPFACQWRSAHRPAQCRFRVISALGVCVLPCVTRGSA